MSMDQKKPVAVALASFGTSGKVFHAPFLSTDPGFALKAILERSGNNSREPYPKARIVRTFTELLNDKSLELIVVNTPDDTHYDYTKQALEAGKHVIVEKPFVMDIAGGEELISLARSKGLMLSVFQNRRWDADFLTARQILDSGLLGRLVEYESSFPRFRPQTKDSWRDKAAFSGGVLYDLGAHLVDQALELFGMPEYVYAEVECQREDAIVNDYFLIRMLYTGLRVGLKSGCLVKEPTPAIRLNGTQGSFVKYGKDVQEAALKAGQMPDQPWWGEENESDWGTINYITAEGEEVRRKYQSATGDYGAYFRNVYAYLREGAPLLTDASKSLDGIRVIEAAARSSRDKAVVKM